MKAPELRDVLDHGQRFDDRIAAFPEPLVKNVLDVLA